MNYTRFFNDGLELYIDVKTGEVFASQRALARMVGVSDTTIKRWFEKQLQGAASNGQKSAETPTNKGIQGAASNSEKLAETITESGIQGGASNGRKSAKTVTDGGLQGVSLYNEDAIYLAFLKYKPELLVQCAKAGLRVYLHGLAGFKWVSVPPQTPLGWSETREKGIEVRKDLTDQIKHYIETHPNLSPNTKKWLYSNVSTLVCKGVFGVKPSELAKKWSANPKTVRDYFTREELSLFDVVESSTKYFIWSKGLDPLEAVKRAIEALDVKPLPTGDQPRIPMRTPKKRLKGI